MLLAAMIAVALAAGLWTTRPLWRAAVESGLRRRTANVLAYRQRLAEIEADQAAGLLDAETAGQLRAELDARLLVDAEADDANGAAAGRLHLVSAVVGLVVVSAATFGYVHDGSWRKQQQIARGPASQPDTPESVEAMVGTLAERMEQNPNDVQGWALLGRSYFVMGRYDQAARAFAAGSRVVEDREPDLLVDHGEALALARERDLLGRPAQLFDAALALDPQHGKALWYAGLAAQQAGDVATARRHWSALAAQDLPDDMRKVLGERLAMVGAEPPATRPGAPDAAPATEDGVVVRVAVRVDPALAAAVPEDAVLFVFARAADGPPMPLAVHRGRAGDLPREVRLDDTMAMQPGLNLSAFPAYEVVARVSRSGGAQARSGDLEGSLTVARGDLGADALALTVDRVVP